MARFGGTSPFVGQGAPRHVGLGLFKRDELDTKPGKPIPFGERPEGRPMAHELGNGRSYANNLSKVNDTSGAQDKVERTYMGMLKRPEDPTYFRSKTGLPLYSWETE